MKREIVPVRYRKALCTIAAKHPNSVFIDDRHIGENTIVNLAVRNRFANVERQSLLPVLIHDEVQPLVDAQERSDGVLLESPRKARVLFRLDPNRLGTLEIDALDHHYPDGNDH